MSFQRVTKFKSWVIGSIVSDTGSEYLFGFDPEKGLKWLERSGIEYSPLDEVWRDAENYIRNAGVMGQTITSAPSVDLSEISENYEEADMAVVMADSHSDERPKTVTRSVAGDTDFAVAQPGDPRIVGDTSPGRDVADDDIAAQATAFLQNLGEEDYESE